MKTSRLPVWFAKSVSYAFASLFVLVIVTSAAVAQDAGQITGRVTDQQDRVVPGAAITIKSVGTGAERTTTADDQGAYIVTALQPGLYDVTVKSGAFAENSQRVEITVGSKVSLDTKLSTQSVAASVDVVAGAGGVEINTTDQQLSDVVTNKQIRELPTLTRNPYDLVGIAGNVTLDVAGRGTGYAINGQRSASTSILLDGGENTDNFTAVVGQAVPLDSVQEFRVITGNFSAEYGRASGGIVNLATIAGNNEFHGTGYGFNRISRLASNGFDNNARGIPRQVFTRNQFGYSVGGPILKNKLFFFNNTEWIRVRSGGATVAFVPTPQLTAATSATTRGFLGGYQTTTPITGRVFTVSQVLSAVGPDNFLATPNSPGGNAFSALPASLPAFGEVTYSTPQDVGGGTPQNDLQMVIRIDANLTDKTQLYGRYALQDQVNAVGTNASSPYQGFNTGSFNFNQNFLLNLTHSFTSNFVSNTKLGFNRLNGGQPLGDQPPGPTLYLNSGGSTRLSGIRIGFPGYLPFSPGSAIPFAGAQNVYQLNEDMSFSSGKHNWRFGGQFIHMRDNKTFGAYLNSVQVLGSNTAEALSNLVTGNLSQFSVAIDPGGRFPTVPTPNTVPLPVSPPSFSRSNRYNEWAVYANDSIRYTPRLTLNLGLRYEYYGVQHNAQDPGLDANFYYGAGATFQERLRNGRFMRAPDSPVGALWRKDKNNFAPRLGFAWDMFGDGSTSFRGGYGLAYERNFGNVTFNALFNPPNYAVVALAANSVNTSGVVTEGDVATLPIFSSNLGPFAGTGPPRRLTAVSARHIDQNIVNAFAHFWSLSLERQLSRNTVASLEYSASHGRNLYSIGDVNRLGCGTVFLGGPTPSASGGTTSRCNGVATAINTRGNLGYSNYGGVTASLESNNFRNLGLTYTARYTYSIARDNLSSTFSDNSAFNLGFVDTYDPKLDYGLADFDVRHRFSSSFNYEVPYKADSAAAKYLLSGWSLNGLVNLRSGYPFSIYDISFATSAAARLTPSGPVRVTNSNSPTTAEPNQFVLVDTSNQTTATPAGPTGNYNFGPYSPDMSRRNAFTGPGFWNVTTGLYKRIHFTERVSVQLRAEVFNLFNHANLFTDYSSATFWTPNADPVFATRDGRRNVQLAAKVIF
ncbi:MAG: carboxypeptidase regulatory-like domain-containing protein [Pyrinomonadaceae bacterium]